MKQNINTDISKFLSYVLRHQPDSIGITLDREGWTDIATLIDAGNKSGKRLNRDLIDAVVAANDKKRFAISSDGLRIRAVQGHSNNGVDIQYVEKIPPEFLYHGTATRFVANIRREGLKPRSRQYVHLSQDVQTATAVGLRHGMPVVLEIQARRMREEGYAFYQAENGVWLTLSVPGSLLGNADGVVMG